MKNNVTFTLTRTQADFLFGNLLAITNILRYYDTREAYNILYQESLSSAAKEERVLTRDWRKNEKLVKKLGKQLRQTI